MVQENKHVQTLVAARNTDFRGPIPGTQFFWGSVLSPNPN
jgi:hypothetical protein